MHDSQLMKAAAAGEVLTLHSHSLFWHEWLPLAAHQGWLPPLQKLSVQPCIHPTSLLSCILFKNLKEENPMGKSNVQVWRIQHVKVQQSLGRLNCRDASHMATSALEEMQYLIKICVCLHISHTMSAQLGQRFACATIIQRGFSLPIQSRSRPWLYWRTRKHIITHSLWTL